MPVPAAPAALAAALLLALAALAAGAAGLAAPQSVRLAARLLFPAGALIGIALAAVALAGLLSLTTPVAVLLDVVERALRPLHRVGVDAARTALLLVVALGTVPTLARLAREVRSAQHARGARGIRAFVIPFLVLALRHADDLGDALTARGVR